MLGRIERQHAARASHAQTGNRSSHQFRAKRGFTAVSDSYRVNSVEITPLVSKGIDIEYGGRRSDYRGSGNFHFRIQVVIGTVSISEIAIRRCRIAISEIDRVPITT